MLTFRMSRSMQPFRRLVWHRWKLFAQPKRLAASETFQCARSWSVRPEHDIPGSCCGGTFGCSYTSRLRSSDPLKSSGLCFGVAALPLSGKPPPLRSISGQPLTVHGRRLLVKVDLDGQPCFLHFYVCDVPYCAVSVERLLRQGFQVTMTNESQVLSALVGTKFR